MKNDEVDKTRFNEEIDRFIKHRIIFTKHLSPCPFCGEQEMLQILPQERKHGEITWRAWLIKCDTCRGAVEVNTGLESAMLSWNRRPGVVGEDYWWFCKMLKDAGVEYPEDFFKYNMAMFEDPNGDGNEKL